jgi:hypothetical protein
VDFKKLWENLIKEMFMSPLVYEIISKSFTSLISTLFTNLKGMLPLEHYLDHCSYDVCCMSLTMIDCVW